ncbi:hypothetical protein ACQ4PT_020856 [Festuca glaucescens]
MAGQRDREETRAAMAGRQNGNSKEKGKEVEGKKVGHQFCRVFSAQESGERFLLSKNEDFGFGFVLICSVVAIFDEMFIEKPSAFHAKPSYNLVATTESEEEDKQISVVPQEENNGVKNKRTAEIDASSSKLRKCSKGASAGYKSIIVNSTEDIVKFQREQAVISRRPPVTEEQKNYALQRAKQYKSKNPITLQIMKETYVYKTYFMIIPFEFVRDYLPHSDKKLTLLDQLGKTWEVSYVYCSERCVGAFSGGWGKFSLGNHLEEFDVCVFELFSEDNIKVHIYRANAMLTEYLVDSSNK